jgi:predicted glycosyltransferase
MSHVLKQEGNTIHTVIKTKDMLEDLVRNDGMSYINVSQKRRKNSYLSIARDVISRNIKIFHMLREKKIDVVIACGSDIAISAKILNIPFFLFNDDDYYIVPKSATYGWPFVTKVFAPVGCDMGKFEQKTIHYNGFQKSFYLQENVFTPNQDLVRKVMGDSKYYIIRLVGLDAHHDGNVKGINESVLDKILPLLETNGKVLISSEKKLPPKYEKHRYIIDPSEMHHFIYYSELLIGDSQSMVHEAALLGTPSIRYNSFVGKIGVLEVLEKEYGLTIGVKAGEENQLLESIKSILATKDYKERIEGKLTQMKSKMTDVNQFAIEYIKNHSRAASTQ